MTTYSFVLPLSHDGTTEICFKTLVRNQKAANEPFVTPPKKEPIVSMEMQDEGSTFTTDSNLESSTQEQDKINKELDIQKNKSRITSVMEKIENMDYGDGFGYDTEDSFIDDSEMDQQFMGIEQSDDGSNHGFFIKKLQAYELEAKEKKKKKREKRREERKSERSERKRPRKVKEDKEKEKEKEKEMEEKVEEVEGELIDLEKEKENEKEKEVEPQEKEDKEKKEKEMQEKLEKEKKERKEKAKKEKPDAEKETAEKKERKERKKEQEKENDKAASDELDQALQELQSAAAKLMDLTQAKRFPKTLDPQFYRVCAAAKKKDGKLSNSIMETLTAVLPFQTNTLRSRYKQLSSIDERASKHTGDVETYTTQLKEKIAKTDPKGTIDNETGEILYKLINAKLGSLKAENEKRKLEGDLEIGIQTRITEFHGKVANLWPQMSVQTILSTYNSIKKERKQKEKDEKIAKQAQAPSEPGKPAAAITQRRKKDPIAPQSTSTAIPVPITTPQTPTNIAGTPTVLLQPKQSPPLHTSLFPNTSPTALPVHVSINQPLLPNNPPSSSSNLTSLHGTVDPKNVFNEPITHMNLLSTPLQPSPQLSDNTQPPL